MKRVLLEDFTDKELADVLEHVLVRRVPGYDETFSALAPHEVLLVRLRITVENWQKEMTR